MLATRAEFCFLRPMRGSTRPVQMFVLALMLSLANFVMAFEAHAEGIVASSAVEHLAQNSADCPAAHLDLEPHGDEGCDAESEDSCGAGPFCCITTCQGIPMAFAEPFLRRHGEVVHPVRQVLGAVPVLMAFERPPRQS